jgi:hypothetical protein
MSIFVDIDVGADAAAETVDLLQPKFENVQKILAS